MPSPATPIARPGKPGGPKGGKPGSPKGGGFANTRIAGVKAPVVLVGLALAIGIGLYIRSRAASSGAATAAPAAADTGATGSGGASGGASDPGSGQDPYALSDAIWGLTGLLGGGQFSGGGADTASFQANTATTTAPTSQELGAYQDYTLASHYSSLTPSQQETLFPLGAPIVGPASTPATPGGTAAGITIPTLFLPASVAAAPTSKATNVQPKAPAAAPNQVYPHAPGANPVAAKRYTAAVAKTPAFKAA